MSKKRNRVDWDDPLLRARLGKEPDSTIAADLGLSRERVRQVRSALGLKANVDRARSEKEQLLTGTRGLDVLVGQISDVSLAEWLGVDADDIRAFREKLGIPVRRALCGTRASYNRGCRCLACNRENANQQLAWRAKNPDKAAAITKRSRERVLTTAPHAVSNVANYAIGCRCVGCKEAHTKWSKSYREKQKEKVAA